MGGGWKVGEGEGERVGRWVRGREWEGGWEGEREREWEGERDGSRVRGSE